MKRKIFATVMALVLCTTTLVGCGHKNDSSPAPADYVESDGPAITDGSDTGKNVTATPYTNEQGEILMQAPNDDIIGNEDFEQAPKEENASLDAESMEEEVLSETGEIEGIIVVQNYFYHADDGISNIFVYSIESINPDTGESTKIAEFSVRRPYNVTSEDFYYLLPIIGNANMVGNDRRYFSNDFSKMAATKVFNDKNERAPTAYLASRPLMP